MDHFDIMSGAVLADVRRARYAAFNRFAGLGGFDCFARFRIDLGGDRFPDRLEMLPRLRIAARHQRWAEARAYFTAGNAGAEEATMARIILFASYGVGP